ncbi:MAG: EsaB/YukD family protein [Clostridia bacterium]|nr:EsaB/YukD family protein [Clostridia bacterium]
METIIVELYLPGVNRSCDISMPSQLPVAAYLPSLAETLQEMWPSLRIDMSCPVLSDMRQRKPLDMKKTLAENGVVDGSRLMLC